LRKRHVKVYYKHCLCMSTFVPEIMVQMLWLFYVVLGQPSDIRRRGSCYCSASNDVCTSIRLLIPTIGQNLIHCT